MTNSKKRTFVFLAIAFALFLCLVITMTNNSTDTVKAETICSEQQALLNDGINSDDSGSSEVEMYNTQEEASYTIRVTKEQYIEKVLYDNIDVSEISADENSLKLQHFN